MGEELGPINYAGDPNANMYFPNASPEYSEKTSELIDKEIKALIDQAYNDAKLLIGENKDKLEAIAQALLKYETLDAEDVQTILDGGILDKPTVSDLLALEQKKNEHTQHQEEEKQSPETTSEDTTEQEPAE
jgi:cell division protease FtsH